MKSHISLLLLVSVLAYFPLYAAAAAAAEAKYTAMYIFGDSLIDNGNNIYFVDSIAKANTLPNGIDFSKGPTGRFCNGKILVDFIAEMLGLPLIPSYADTVVKGVDILSGVNYASAGAGILNDTGYRFGRIIPLGRQVSNFKKTVARLRRQMQEEEFRSYLGRAVVFMDIGTNDYINNYLRPRLYLSSHIYDPQQFNDLLIKLYRQQILEIQSLGLRKFFIAEASPAGCIPLLVSNGECDPKSNKMVKTLNTQLKSLVHSLKSDYPGSAFMLAPSFDVFLHIRDNAEAYGFKVRDKACCGESTGGDTKPRCFRDSVPCGNRDEYMFWDGAHPTEATNRILAHIIYSNTSWQ